MIHLDFNILVGGDRNMTGLFFHILGMSSSQLTNSYFSEGFKPPTRTFQREQFIAFTIGVKATSGLIASLDFTSPLRNMAMQ